MRRAQDKRPLTTTGAPASSTDPTTWSDFDEAATSEVGAGLGFVLNGDGIICVDLDHCLDGRGRPTPEVAELLEQLPPTYVEVSPSGDGLHVWGLGDVPRGRRTAGFEVYGTGRYITITAKRYRHAPASLADLTAWLSLLPL